jgi:glycosyltransferase involved in cell wall biosynthesis
MNKISVIIPIYNTGEHLKRCIASVTEQSLKNIEIILVDDGSTDNSGSICDEYAKKDNRITVIHKKNEGVSIARNTGIEKASGEFIGFVDSDDWIDKEMYSDLYDAAVRNDADIVMCDATTKYDTKPDEADTITQLPESIILNKKNIAPSLLMEMAGAAWRCIYRKELLKDNNIVFPINLKFSEDRIFNILAFGYADSIYYIKKSYYNRYIRKGSAVSKYYDNMIDIVLDARQRIRSAVDSAWNGNKAYKDMYENQIIGLSYTAINNIFYKDSPLSFKESYNAVKDICGRKELVNALKTVNRNDLRARLILRKQVMALCVLAKILNKKYGR